MKSLSSSHSVQSPFGDASASVSLTIKASSVHQQISSFQDLDLYTLMRSKQSSAARASYMSSQQLSNTAGSRHLACTASISLGSQGQVVGCIPASVGIVGTWHEKAECKEVQPRRAAPPPRRSQSFKRHPKDLQKTFLKCLTTPCPFLARQGTRVATAEHRVGQQCSSSGNKL
eukprot:1146433-Pelagomonas_calceolata.AAC.3